MVEHPRTPVPGAPPLGQDWEGSVLALTWLGLFLSPAWIAPASVNPRHLNRCLWLSLGLPRGQRLEMDLGYSGLPLQEGAWSACGPAVSVHSWVLEASVPDLVQAASGAARCCRGLERGQRTVSL